MEAATSFKHLKACLAKRLAPSGFVADGDIVSRKMHDAVVVIEVQKDRKCSTKDETRLSGLSATPVEVMRIDGQTGADTVVPWGASTKLVESPLDAGALLVAYFAIAGNDAAGRQSVTLDTRQGSSVVTLSLDRRLAVNDGLFASSVLTGLSGWAMEAFDAAALACGPELDLYEVGDEQDL